MSNQKDIQSAIQFFQKGNIKQAKQMLDRYIVSYPDDINANLLSAAISATESDFITVIKRCDKVLAIDPANVRAAYNAAVACEKLKRFQDVRKFSLHVLQYDAANVPAKLLLSGALYDMGEYDELQKICTQIILENNDNSEVMASICTIFSIRKNAVIAEKIFEHVLKCDAENMAVLFNLVAINVSERNFAKAEKFVDRLTSLNPIDINTIRAKAIIFHKHGEDQQCIKFIEKLPPSIVSGDPVIMMKLAECYMESSEYERATSIFQQCIASNIKVSECFHNIAIIKDRQGNLNEAIKSYQSALSINPDSLNTNYNLAFILDKKGDKSQAIKAINKCFEIHSSPVVRRAFVKILSTATIHHIDTSTEKNIFDVVSDEVTNAKHLACLVVDLLKLKYPVVNRLITFANDGDYDSFVIYLGQGLKELKGNLKLQMSFVNLPITRYDFECFSKMLRRALLLQSYEYDVNELSSALAIRCYIDGYVFTVTKDEDHMVKRLLDRFEENKEGSDKKNIALLSMYVSLYELYEKNAGLNINSADYDGVYRKLLKLQLDDNIYEESLYDSIESYSKISNETSLTVKRQYEGNPYPVWQIIDVHEPEPIKDVILSATSCGNDIKCRFDNPDILIAGCGTGSHALQTAMRIQHQSMTALDLSRRSLAFAKRKAAEYGFKDIDFKQLDILNVSDLKKKFDVIESVGVLHHMQDPLAGLKCLVDILKPDGFMNIGLYSKLGRRYIIKSKEIYDNPDRYVSDDEIREARISLMNSDDEQLVNNISSYTDFYSLHDCRDLIFHENEKNYNVDELESLLEDAGLEFIGFDSHEPSVLSRFRKMFPEKKSQSRLKNWGEYEEKYPDTFASMYVFWCRKKSS